MEPPAATRLKLTVHYDGAAFHGWQLQPDQRTIQGELEAAASRLADSPRVVIGSGRTDTGVHATGQVAAVDMPAQWTPDKLRTSLNSLLPDDIWVERADAAAPNFHPRYDAMERTYRYHVGLLPVAASPFHRRWCWPLSDVIDRVLLDRAAETIVGEHSFRSFSKAGQPERGERCHVLEAAWSDSTLGVELRITADRYLHHMVRYLVGTMVEVARSRRPLEDMTRLLRNDDDTTTSAPAPPQGLFLEHVRYPEGASRPQAPEPPPRRSTATP